MHTTQCGTPLYIQLLMHAIAHRDCTDTIRRVCTESYLWEKKPVVAPGNQTCLAFWFGTLSTEIPHPNCSKTYQHTVRSSWQMFCWTSARFQKSQGQDQPHPQSIQVPKTGVEKQWMQSFAVQTWEKKQWVILIKHYSLDKVKLALCNHTHNCDKNIYKHFNKLDPSSIPFYHKHIP